MATCLVQLRDGDTLASLASEYGISAQQICALNGVAWSSSAIDAWVMSHGGRRAAYDPSQPYDSARQLGWALFTSSSQIQLPNDDTRPCVGSTTTPGASATKSSGLGALAWLGLGLGALLAARALKKKGRSS